MEKIIDSQSHYEVKYDFNQINRSKYNKSWDMVDGR